MDGQLTDLDLTLKDSYAITALMTMLIYFILYYE